MNTLQETIQATEANSKRALEILREISPLVTHVPSIRTSGMTKAHPGWLTGWEPNCLLYVTEASDMQWKPGQWPTSFRVLVDTDIGNPTEYTAEMTDQPQDEGEDGGWAIYRIVGTDKRFIRVYND